MTLPVPVVLCVLAIAVLLIGFTIVSLSAWYGIHREREEDRSRLMRGGWACDDCGRTMRFVGDTVGNDAVPF